MKTLIQQFAIPRSKIILVHCEECFKKHKPEIRYDYGNEFFSYCEYCGKIVFYGPVIHGSHFITSDAILGINTFLTIEEDNYSDEIYQQFRIQGLTTEELVAALLDNQICIVCHGAKQIWNSGNKMMEDCKSCNGRGNL